MNGIEKRLTELCGDIGRADDASLLRALMQIVRERADANAAPVMGRKLYYISAEFLIGRLLVSNLMNLGLYGDVRAALERHGRSLAELEEMEAEPGLGNGGLGRLAACFLDSLAAMNLPGDGVGLRYHCGLFRQKFVDELQCELPDRWLGGDGWAERTDKVYPVSLGGREVYARLYRIAVTGARINFLNLFDLDSVDESAVGPGIAFDKEDIEKSLTLFLYPDDSDAAGRRLRLFQQYFMVSAGAQLILDECVGRGSDLHDLADYAAVQINDTHPSMVIPELIRLLGERGIGFDEAVEIVTQVCAYTNHTILAEALEKWPMEEIEAVAPQLIPIIRRLDETARARTDDPAAAVIDEWNRVHMAHIDIHFAHSVNGVAQLHTEILKNEELKQFHRLYPEKFRSVTNGISFRRWLTGCNPLLTEWIEGSIGPDFRKDADALEGLIAFREDESALSELADIKRQNKIALAQWLEQVQGVRVNPDSMFSIQAKRLHEYKRQQLNLLFLIHQYLEIRAGKLPPVPLTAIFGAKAAPAYTIAKDIIHALRVLARVIEQDEAAGRHIRIAFVENYNVSAAEKLIPACDLSEQISLAGKEASGTGNMKFMLSGAVTLGTMDGANVEIARLVGGENIYIFGQSAQQVIRRYAAGDYCAREWYESDENIRRAVDFLTGEEMLSFGSREHLQRLKHELVGKDWFQTFPDFNAYLVRKQQAMADYAGNQAHWRKKCLVNIARAGYFSSDRTIREYNEQIWRLGQPLNSED